MPPTSETVAIIDWTIVSHCTIATFVDLLRSDDVVLAFSDYCRVNVLSRVCLCIHVVHYYRQLGYLRQQGAGYVTVLSV